MPSPTLRLLTVPTSLTLLCCLHVQPLRPYLFPFNAAPVTAVAPQEAEPLVKREVPRIVAVDKRIARRVNALRPCVKARLARVVARLPKNVTLMVTSARRTRQEQASLRSTFGVKAKPGRSTHEDGRAIDVNVIVDGERIRPRVQNKVIGEAMASEGFRYLGPRDPVHYSIPKENIDPTLEHGPNLDVMTMGEMLQLKAEIALQSRTELASTDAALPQP